MRETMLLIGFVAAHAVAVCGCAGSAGGMGGYKATVRSARDALPVAREMEEVFHEVDHFITHYGFGKQPLVWNTEAHFGGRYILTMQVPVNIDYGARTVKQSGSPKFYLVEVTKVDRLSDGRFMASTDGGAGMEFTEHEWKEVYESNGDLSVLGITVNEEELPNFKDYVAAVREPRVPVSLLNDALPKATP